MYGCSQLQYELSHAWLLASQCGTLHHISWTSYTSNIWLYITLYTCISTLWDTAASSGSINYVRSDIPAVARVKATSSTKSQMMTR